MHTALTAAPISTFQYDYDRATGRYTVYTCTAPKVLSQLPHYHFVGPYLLQLCTYFVLTLLFCVSNKVYNSCTYYWGECEQAPHLWIKRKIIYIYICFYYILLFYSIILLVSSYEINLNIPHLNMIFTSNIPQLNMTFTS